MKPAPSRGAAPPARTTTTDSYVPTPEETPTLLPLDVQGGAAGLPPPSHVKQRFHDEGEIGTGGSGSIRRVLDRKLQRRIAMKTLAPHLPSSQLYVGRFVREAQIVAQLDHPNVPPIHDLAFDPDGRPYFTMKLVNGQTLRKRVGDEGDRLGDPEVLGGLLAIFLKVCEAVAYAHSRGICHCDIKPENVMVGSFGEAYLMDWGIAFIKEGTSTSDMLPVDFPAASGKRRSGVRGTPAYMAPEQAAGQLELIGERTDVFGLGALLFFITTGAAPFAGRDTIESLRKAKRSRVIVPPGVLVPAPLQRVIDKAMSARPESRHASVMELHRDVDGILRGAWHLPTRRYPPGQHIVTEGEPGDSAFVILSGTCLVTKNVGRRRKVLRRLGPGDVFGETAVLSRKRRTATVEAAEEVVVRVVTRDVLERELGVETDLGKFVLALADRFCQMDAKLTQLEGRLHRRRRKKRTGMGIEK